MCSGRCSEKAVVKERVVPIMKTEPFHVQHAVEGRVVGQHAQWSSLARPAELAENSQRAKASQHHGRQSLPEN